MKFNVLAYLGISIFNLFGVAQNKTTKTVKKWSSGLVLYIACEMQVFKQKVLKLFWETI